MGLPNLGQLLLPEAELFGPQQVAEVVVGVKTDPLYAGVEHEAAAHEQLAEVLHVDAVAAARGGMR